eukprot:COSAG02_NODE_30_length_50867_cov_66.594331_25_plen_266_part_00
MATDACTHANCEVVEDVSCEAIGGILGTIADVQMPVGAEELLVSADVCCPAECGVCEQHGCGQISNRVPPLRSGGRACCPRDIVIQQQADMAESDRCRNGVCAGEDGIGGVISSTCGDTGVEPPCLMPMECKCTTHPCAAEQVYLTFRIMRAVEWRGFMVDFDVKPGAHKLYVHAREDGTRLRAVQLAQRGSCGFAPDLLLPATVDASWGTLQSPMAILMNGLGAQSGVWVDPAVLDPSLNCANQATAESHVCGSVAFEFSCAGQ